MRLSQEDVHSGWTESDHPSSSQRAQAPQRLTLPRTLPGSSRVRKRTEFLAIRGKRRFLGEALAIDSIPSSRPKLGITVPKKYGNAVKRNRFKRRVRAAFASMRSSVPDLACVVLPKKGITDIPFQAIQQDLEKFYAQSTAAKGG